MLVLKGLFGNSPIPFFKWDSPNIYPFCNRKKTLHKAGTPVELLRKNLLVVENSWDSNTIPLNRIHPTQQVASTEGIRQVTSKSI